MNREASCLLDQLGQFLARIEHAGLHGCGRDTENLRTFTDRLLVVIDEIDDLPMLGGYWSGAPLNDFNDGTDFLVKQLKLKKSPVNWCSQADAR
jgi:hypothetical protein